MMKQMSAELGKNKSPSKIYRESLRQTRILGTTRHRLSAIQWEKSSWFYFDALRRAAADNAAFRKFAGDNDPALRILKSLREAYPPGAEFLAPEGETMAYGSGGNVYHRIGLTSPHLDLPFSDDQKQFSALVYFVLPKEGGELVLWPQKEMYFLSPSQQQSRQGTVLRPSSGELIIFETTCIHAVADFTKGPRISAKIWFGFQSDHPLELYN